MRYSPKPCDGRARRLMWILIGVGAVCFCLSSAFAAGRAVLQLGGVVLLAGGIFMAVRYELTEFTYEVALRGTAAAEEALPAVDVPVDLRYLSPSLLDFTIRKSQGRRGSVLDACFGLDALLYFALLPLEGGREREPYRRYPSMRVFTYTVSLSPNAQYMAVFSDGADGQVGLVLECGAEMAALLGDVALKNAASRAL